jgi:hypothetical protein
MATWNGRSCPKAALIAPSTSRSDISVLPTRDQGSWGFEPQEAWGLLHTDRGVVTLPSEHGAYQEYYTQFAAARYPPDRGAGG